MTLEHIDELGTPTSYNHYNTGWAWAFDTPFPYWKRWAGAEGGVADMCFVSWPAKIAADPTPRQQYIHAVDVVPTIYELLGIEPPEVIKGYLQSPIEGESFAEALTDANVPGKETQFYTMLGQRSIYHDGWLASTLHPPLSGWGEFEKDEWELFHLETDRSQSKNVAADHPERVESFKELWFYYAGIYNGLPLDDRSALEQVLAERPRGAPDARALRVLPRLRRRSRVRGRRDQRPLVHDRRRGGARLRRRRRRALYAHGGVAGGHSLYVKDKRLKYAFNWVGTTCRRSRRTARSPRASTSSPSNSSSTDRAPIRSMPGFAGTATLYIDDEAVGSGTIVTQPGYFCLVGDGICVGRDSASPVTPDYADRGTFAFTGGTIDKVVVDVTGEQYVDHEAQVRGLVSENSTEDAPAHTCRTWNYRLG